MDFFLDVPSTGWFVSNDPQHDYEMLKAIAARSVFGDRDTVEMLDLVGLEEDFRKGKYGWQDYYLGFVDGGGRSEQAKNAIHDMNSYLKALRDAERRYGSLERVAAVRFHQTGCRIDGIELAMRDAAPSALIV